MFLNAVILILQEILEAAMLISVLLVLISLLRRSGGFERVEPRWLASAILLGLAGAWCYAWITPTVSAWFDYVGYEVVNASLQLIAITQVLLFCHLLYPGSLQHDSGWKTRAAQVCMIAVVAIGIVREGSEIILYIQGIMGQRENVTPVMLGALMATGIGVSSSFLLYHALCALRVTIALRLALLLLALFAGNMAAQATLLLTQADWLPYTRELWNTGDLMPEYSITGQLLYALVGYEANPSLLQVLSYVAAAALVGVSPLFRSAWSRKELAWT
jgi:high-affinity iron transporter